MIFVLKPYFRKTSPIDDVPNQVSIPNGTWIKCTGCKNIVYKQDIDKNQQICPNCKEHYRMTAWERIQLLLDKDSFEEYDHELDSQNLLDFPGYDDKVKEIQKNTQLSSAVITGQGRLGNNDVVIAVMDSRFMMGSMGQVVGEKITRAIEKATEMQKPLLILTASGGARMQEGIFSLMQMAKTSAALKRHQDAGQLYISILTDPTTGGVTASFAMLGDIILAEPGALIGFAGRRVIQQTIGQKLPEDFQRAEFLLEHGLIDAIVDRKDMKNMLMTLLNIHMKSYSGGENHA